MRINKYNIIINSTPIKARDVQTNKKITTGLNTYKADAMYLANFSPNTTNSINTHQAIQNYSTRHLAILSKRVKQCQNHPSK